jgi:hypothetical protein
MSFVVVGGCSVSSGEYLGASVGSVGSAICGLVDVVLGGFVAVPGSSVDCSVVNWSLGLFQFNEVRISSCCGVCSTPLPSWCSTPVVAYVFVW